VKSGYLLMKTSMALGMKAASASAKMAAKRQW